MSVTHPSTISSAGHPSTETEHGPDEQHDRRRCSLCTELVARVEPHEDGGWTVDVVREPGTDSRWLERWLQLEPGSLHADVATERQARRAARKLLNRARRAAEFPRTGFVIR